MESAAPNPTANTVVVACAHCGTKNRVLAGRLADATCGNCKSDVLPGQPVNATEATFARQVEEAPLPVLVDFWAPWCGPCRAIAPALEKIAGERRGRVKVVKVNVDENPHLQARFGIQAIPTMMVFRGAQVVDQIRGALPKPALDARLDKLGV